MRTVEYRYTLPFSSTDFRLGQRYMTAECAARARASGPAAGSLTTLSVEKYITENGGAGEYTRKMLEIGDQLPKFVTSIINSILGHGGLTLLEECWNEHPYCYTRYTNPVLEKKLNFFLDVTSVHAQPTKDTAPFVTPPPAPDRVPAPRKQPSIHTIMESDHPDASTAYKFLRCHIGGPLGHTLEHTVMDSVAGLFENSHKAILSWQDKWQGMTALEISEFEIARAGVPKLVRVAVPPTCELHWTRKTETATREA